jgi:putative acetyltransferase
MRLTQVSIRRDDLSAPAVHALLQEHLRSLSRLSPPESMHALGIDALRRPEISFWTAWSAGDLLGCGALKELDSAHGEIKSMRTAASHLRKGVGRAMLAHIVEEARRRSYARLSLETGSTPEFAPARRLYEGFGFVRCGPFADYREDPFSVYMSRLL